MVVTANALDRQWSVVGDDVLAAVGRVGSSGWYVLGEAVRRFEHDLAAAVGRRHAIGCGNGLDAIEIALRGLGISPGAPVLTTPLSAYATTLAIRRAGGIPVFVDTDASGQLDLAAARRLLEQRPDIRFCVPVHLYGHALDLGELARLRVDFGLSVVEDAAQALGAMSGELRVGDVGQAVTTSFYPTKNLAAMGDGGALLTDSEPLIERARTLRDYGQDGKYHHVALGLNSRLDELQAAILAEAMLPRWEEWNRRRGAIAARYLDGIDHPLVRPLPVPPRSTSVWHLFPVMVGEGLRDDFLQFLGRHDVQGLVHYPTTIPDQPVEVTARLGEAVGELPRARALAAGEVSLPIHPFLTEAEVDQVMGVIARWRP